MSWSEEDTFLLVDLVRRRPSLYDQESEAFSNEKRKMQIAEELTTIISSARPGTTVKEVLQRWAELCAKFVAHCQKLAEMNKNVSQLFYYEKMKFMIPFVAHLINPRSEQGANKENKDKNNKEVTENDSKPIKSEDSLSELYTPQIKIRRSDESETEKSQNITSLSRDSLSTISVHSDKSSLRKYDSPGSFSGSERKGCRKTPTAGAQSGNNTVCDASCVTLPSPLVNVNDSIMDRSESFNGVAFMLSRREDLVLEDDEDALYCKYIVCKLKKLDEARKLKFKVEVEKLFYESMNNLF